MSATTLVSQINRSDTFPKYVEVQDTKNSGFLSIELSNWTSQMFYELPFIQFNIYTKIGTKYVQYLSENIFVNTYTADIEPNTNICYSLKNLPDSCYIGIIPYFDDDATSARNMLIENGIESGTIWTTKTDTFDITIKYITI